MLFLAVVLDFLLLALIKVLSIAGITHLNDTYDSIGDKMVPMTASERKSVTKVFGPTSPQKQYLRQVQDSTLCLNEETYLHRYSATTYDTHDHQSSERFEKNGLSSFVDSEMRRLHHSKFLNTKMSSVDAGGIRKGQKRDNGSLMDNRRRGVLGKREVERDKSVCDVKGIVVKNNNEKLVKYSKRPRNIPNSRDADSLY
jgi:hypothetical protein